MLKDFFMVLFSNIFLFTLIFIYMVYKHDKKCKIENELAKKRDIKNGVQS